MPNYIHDPECILWIAQSCRHTVQVWAEQSMYWNSRNQINGIASLHMHSMILCAGSLQSYSDPATVYLLTLGAHAPEGYGTWSVCVLASYPGVLGGGRKRTPGIYCLRMRVIKP